MSDEPSGRITVNFAGIKDFPEFTDELRAILAPLNIIKVRGEVIHIRAVVDGEYIVSRQWIARRQYWRYSTAHWYNFFAAHENGQLKNHGRDKA